MKHVKLVKNSILTQEKHYRCGPLICEKDVFRGGTRVGLRVAMTLPHPKIIIFL
jgi:hypothetical protein